MELVKQILGQAGWSLGFQPDGRELLVVVAKATYTIPEGGGEALLAKEQCPLVQADEFTGEPGYSSIRYESDYAHRKPFCDVLLNGSAYAPNGQPCERVTVTMRVGPINKCFVVTGNRVWDNSLLWNVRTPPEPFIRLPISYDCAYGGTDKSESNPEKIKTYLANPFGVGYYPLTKANKLIGKPLPNTHEVGRPATAIRGKYRPMSFGPIGRNFESRIPLAGTYDKKWLEERVPFFPGDFDYRYFQCAPPDQQIPHPKGGEQIDLENLTPDGFRCLRLPKMPMPVLFIPHRGEVKQQDAVIDTVFIEPDKNRFMLTWRTSIPLKKSCFEIRQIVVGKTAGEHRRETVRATKIHYANLEELIRAKKSGHAK